MQFEFQRFQYYITHWPYSYSSSWPGPWQKHSNVIGFISLLKSATPILQRAHCCCKTDNISVVYKQFWEVRIQLQLDRPRTKMLFSPHEFHMFWRNISNYHGESDGVVALLSPYKFAMFWNNISNSLHESNVSDSVDFSIRHVIIYLANHWVNRSVHLWIDFCVNHWINF